MPGRKFNVVVCFPLKVDKRQDADLRQNPHGEDHNPRGGWAEPDCDGGMRRCVAVAGPS